MSALELDLEKIRMQRNRDKKAKSARIFCCSWACGFLIVGSTLCGVSNPLANTPNPLMLLSIVVSFSLVILCPIVYIIWFIDPIKRIRQKIKQQNQDTVTEFEPEQDFETEYKYLIDGFIRINFINLLIENQYQYYPTELTKLIFKYISPGFDIYPDEYKHIIKNNGTLIDGSLLPSDLGSSSIMTIGCLNGFKSGINIFKLKCISFSQFDCIGVITTLVECNKIFNIEKSNYHAFYLKESFGVCYAGHSSYLKGGRWDAVLNNAPPWTPNTDITVTVDCINWKITFDLSCKGFSYCNKSMKIIANEIYYPVICVSVTSCKYVLLQKRLMEEVGIQ